jgi:hypothetical protein
VAKRTEYRAAASLEARIVFAMLACTVNAAGVVHHAIVRRDCIRFGLIDMTIVIFTARALLRRVD